LKAGGYPAGVGNRILGVALLALAGAGIVFLGDRVEPRHDLVVTAGPQEPAGEPDAVTRDTTAAGDTETVAAPGSEAAPPLADSAPAPAATPAGPSGSPAAAAPPLTDHALAQQMVVRAEDLPAGFVQQAAGAGRSSASGDDAFDNCLGSETAALRRALKVRAQSPGFSRRPANAVSSSVALFDTPASAARALAVIRSEAARA
jgi:hypothetical protein